MLVESPALSAEPAVSAELALSLSFEVVGSVSLATLAGGSEAHANRQVTKRMLEIRRTQTLYENENGFQN